MKSWFCYMLITACCPVPPCGGPIYEAGACGNIEHADDIYIYIYRLIMLCHSWPITFFTFYNINLLKWDYKTENSKTYLQILSTTTSKSKSS